MATLGRLGGSAYAGLEEASARLEDGLRRAASAAGLAVRINRVGSMVGIFFSSRDVRNYADARSSDFRLYPAFHREMLGAGVYLPPSPFETIFVSTAHSSGDVDATVVAARRAFGRLAS